MNSKNLVEAQALKDAESIMEFTPPPSPKRLGKPQNSLGLIERLGEYLKKMIIDDKSVK